MMTRLPIRVSAISILLLSALRAFATIDAYDFKDPSQEQRFRQLTGELRCPKCQNQTIADSNAPLSQDLRQRVYEMIGKGYSDAEIIAFMVNRYGDFITYRPPLKPTTWPLWFGPFAVLIGIAIGLGIWIRQRARRLPAELTAQEQERLRSLLAEGSEEQRR
jgi:cytochrome c-type biogenesis protein CcmH